MTRTFDDLDQLKLPPELLPKYAEPFKPAAPEKIRRRREQFVMVPLWWYEKLSDPLPHCMATWSAAVYLLHLHWKHRGKPFPLANGMLRYDGIDRNAKYRALVDLQQRGLITVDRRRRKSPIIHVHTKL